MASRFPSIEELDDGQTSPIQAGSTPLDLGLDDADDFLAREREALGDTFATDNDNDLLGGGGDTIMSDNFGGGSGGVFDNSFPELNVSNEGVGPGGVITASAEPYLPGHNSSYPGMALQEEEPEVIKQWRERQTLEIQRRDELSESHKRETIEKAQRSIDDFYENYNSKRDKAIEQTRTEAQEFLDSRENTVSGGTAWERIAKLVDLTDKGARSGKSDKTRFREMLLSLKKDEKAPGASGF